MIHENIFVIARIFKISTPAKVLSIFLLIYTIFVFWLICQNSSSLAYVRAFALDEAHMTNMVFTLLEQSSFNPQGFYNYGGGYYYPALIILHVANSFMEITHQHVVILLRFISLVAATGVGVILYFISQELKIKSLWKVGASVLFLIIPGVISQIIGAHPDMLQTFYLLLGIYFLMKISQSNDTKKLLKVSFIAGLAAGVKYGGIFLLATLVCYLVLLYKVSGTEKPSTLQLFKRIALISLSFVLGFLLFNPYVLLYPKEFIVDILYESYHVKFGNYFGESWNPVIWVNLLADYYLSQVILVFIALFTIGAFIKKLFLLPNAVKIFRYIKWVNSWSAPLLFTLLYSLYLVINVNFHVPRYLLPILPIVCLLIVVILISYLETIEKYKINSFIIKKIYITVILILGVNMLSTSFGRIFEFLDREGSIAIQVNEFLEQQYPVGTKVWKTEYVYLSEHFETTGSAIFLLEEKIYRNQPQLLLINDYFFDFYLNNSHKKNNTPEKTTKSIGVINSLQTNSFCGFKRKFEINDGEQIYYIFEKTPQIDLEDCVSIKEV